ncbi:transglutaminase-like domain-containing protein [Chitinimonas taiwanensis]|uniref:Transglutaminase-like superfamily protein n=1 Tax=Chitinimonas taiwanensis DSM 18899 TaxID=1121279 RepID=A0A1K2H6Q6_9NEIS|nr:transglutaminase-like domain-containing protein [Chitinimonas taiwanensis]SFZ71627.1 Transglutaminase-like superfamily protein [Chitinimonas taiwanensis DSM 18899]
MLVKLAPPRRRWAALAIGCLLVLLACAAMLLPYLRSGSELVRLRNAWLLQDAPRSGVNWTPAAWPADFRQEPGPSMALFATQARALKLAELPDDWQRAQAISRHLLTGSAVLHGGAIQSDLQTTYQRIVQRGDGYCGDFVRAFTALALAAEVPVRQWAFSFDGFGGHGHVWPEIWNRQAQRWQLVDVFNNAYFTAADGQILSALAFRQALREAPDSIRMQRLVAEARPGYAEPAKAWDYYRRGQNEWYLWWGNNVFEYDRAVLVRALGGVSRSLEQVGGILQGVQPRLQVLEEPANLNQLQALRSLRLQLQWLVVLGAVAKLGLLLSLIMLWRTRPSRQETR